LRRDVRPVRCLVFLGQCQDAVQRRGTVDSGTRQKRILEIGVERGGGGPEAGFSGEKNEPPSSDYGAPRNEDEDEDEGEGEN